MSIIAKLPLNHLAIVSQSALRENPERKGGLIWGTGKTGGSSLAGVVGEAKWVGLCGCAVGVRKGPGRQ